jgi:hypothetical protein
MGEYLFEGKTVEKVYESFRGDYWVITDDSSAHPFGYACLAGMPDMFNEWGTINRSNIDDPNVWEVESEHWPYTGPDAINITEQ